jgi:hypothetical protein
MRSRNGGGRLGRATGTALRSLELVKTAEGTDERYKWGCDIVAVWRMAHKGLEWDILGGSFRFPGRRLTRATRILSVKIKRHVNTFSFCNLPLEFNIVL